MELKWWQKAVFYQIYPRSFADRNGDGVGDIPGIIERLDYLQDLGIDALWLSPHYPSPLFDCGYDISDHVGVASEYGTLDDLKSLLDAAHGRGMHVIFDWVLNHTSDQHPWFKESRSSRSAPRRDWYIWRDGKDGGPPNNWVSAWGGPAWQYDPATGQYYYHRFFQQQPDLNWRNLDVKQAMVDAMRFWLDLGVDGYRLDAIPAIFEDPDLTDHKSDLSRLALRRLIQNPPSREQRAQLFQHQLDLPEVHDLMRELRAVVDAHDDRVLVGETDGIGYYGDGEDELHLVFNFPLMRTNRLTPDWVHANQRERLGALPPGAWPCNTLGNHDHSRSFGRFGDGQHDAALARISLALLLTLRGTPFLYYGEEIGMTDLLLDDIAQFRDMLGVWFYRIQVEELGSAPRQALKAAARFTRDRCRTPMQWSGGSNAGFSPGDVQTWLPVNPNYAQGVNVAHQLGDAGSLLNFSRRLLRLRKETPALTAGDYIPLHTDAEGYFAFLRHSRAHHQVCLIVLNMSARPYTLCFHLQADLARPLFSSHPRESEMDNLFQLPIAPFEVYIGALDIQ